MMPENASFPVVSVVMPTFNQANLLRDAVRSVLDQDFPRWELLVINNYSDDNTIEVLESFSDTRITYENFRNHGIIAASRNRGIHLARGQFIAFLDSDDLWYPSKLSTCLASMTTGVDAVCHRMHVRQDGAQVPAPVLPPVERDLYWTLLFRGNSLITTSSVLIRKELLRQVGGLCEDREIVSSEDYDLWLRLARQGTRFLLLSPVLGEYRIHRESASQNIRRQSDAEAEVVAREFRRILDPSLSMRIRKKRRMGLVYLRAARRYQLAGDLKNASLSVLKALRVAVRSEA